ncbi:hypothetical protein [Sporosarcina koreensis]|uniref:hypothetical protein n=1 Tax=Sporosarcina koreensis TaxID=334735 RepID=UPI00075A02DD|nr:hypothetical protein [Sporosarcina koreensis]
MRRLFSFLLLIFLLGACNRPTANINEVESGASGLKETDSITMPESKPDDFNFSTQFGYWSSNEINTFEGTFTKDLIEAGTVTTDVTFTEEEMNFIYGKMKEINIADAKQLIPEIIDCSVEPYEEDKWEVLINGETISHTVPGAYCNPTNDAKQLIELRDTILDLIKEKDSYKELPDAEGGYE